MIHLPQEFQESMKALLGEEYNDYLNSFDVPRIYGLRANTLKWTPQECQSMIQTKLTPVPWTNNGFFYEEEAHMSKDPYYYAGLYYLQEPSAMTPASILPVEPGDKVLDICAAPGGKSTELGAKLRGQGLLFANDISNSRAKALLKNLELFGVPNICVTSETPEKLAAAYPEYFDKILIDAPCSGEGMFRKDPDMVKDWLEKGPEFYAPIQKGILNQALRMLKPGGCLVYSTCTFARLEDEDVIEGVLDTHPEMELVPIPLFEGACDGIGLSGCIRLFPHKLQGEGHFLAMLRKQAGVCERVENAAGDISDGKRRGPAKQVSGSQKPGINLEKEPELLAFLKQTSIDWEPSRFYIRDDSVYYLPESFEPAKGLRYLRTGLLVGTLKKGRFEPSQALAMVLGPDTFQTSVSFARQDDRVIRYLKGETISLHDHEAAVRGWCLVCVDGYALGFAKGTGQTLKNKYYPGWRWM